MDATTERVGSVEIEESEFQDEYEDFNSSDHMRFLTETNDIRTEEELAGPRVET